MKIFLIFPNQLFDKPHEFWNEWDRVVLVEHDIGFGGPNAPVPNFHIKRLMFLRASMNYYVDELKSLGCKSLEYIQHKNWQQELKKLVKSATVLGVYHTSDIYLQKDIESLKRTNSKLQLEWFDNPNWILTDVEAMEMLGKPPFKNYNFYTDMRKKNKILMTSADKPIGGQIRFDTENRLKIPTSELDDIPDSPSYLVPAEIVKSCRSDFPNALALSSVEGKSVSVLFPMKRRDYILLLRKFIKTKLDKFGPYEDAICSGEVEGGATNYHSVISGGLNIGLIKPMEVINSVVRNMKGHPIESVEGFIAQILGWREYMRALYLFAIHNPSTSLAIPSDGRHNKLGDSWYRASTGLLPLDDILTRTIQNGYNHHIERLMVIGSVMYMCNIEPREVYNWFNEMYLDSWDWVMYGNVFIMSQYCFPKLATTKPYFSSSNYIIKMSNYKIAKYSNGNVPWQIVWDALYWNKVNDIREILKRNYRMAAQVAFYNKKTESEKKEIEKISRNFIKTFCK